MSIEDVRALVERYLPSFIAGERAPANCYADRVTVWHNIGEREEVLSLPPSFGRAGEVITDLRREDVAVFVHDTGFVLKATTVGTTPDGTPFRIPACVLVHVADGRINRFDEYADSAAAAPFIAALSSGT